MSWVTEEVKMADFGDKRLNRRLGNLLEMLSKKPTVSIPASSKGWHETKAAYRFFSHEQVDAEKILLCHKEATVKRMDAESVVLLIQDTTELDYTAHDSKEDIGLLNYEGRRGCYLHPTIAVTPERVCLGVIDAQFIHREGLKHADRTYKQESIEDKESFRWIQSYRAANKIASELKETSVVSVSDREGDIYELFMETNHSSETNSAHWIVRSNQDRRLLSGPEDRLGLSMKLREQLKNSSCVGEVSFVLPKGKARRGREITQKLKAGSIWLRPLLEKGSVFRRFK